ncbi:MAG TPA: hypothetical protein VGL02_00370 [Streptomyces sp.]
MGYRVHGRAVPGQPPPTRPIAYRRLLEACWAGRLPAELLEPGDRDQLIYDLWKEGWTDAQVAVHTRLTTYTAARIRLRLGLAARPMRSGKETGAA